jgi:hypothetical protein
VARVVREFEISDNVLYCWRTEQPQVESQGHSRQTVHAEQEELTRLKWENETLQRNGIF